jgi:hypothetical protein
LALKKVKRGKKEEEKGGGAGQEDWKTPKQRKNSHEWFDG